jgi:phosphoribosylaminoimidazole-succinocarboxamide synthase
MTTLLQTDLGLGSVHRGKVRDCYDLGEQMLIVSTDRISAFDWILPTPIPDKGRVLTAISAFWFEWLGVEHHLITTDVSAMGLPARVDLAPLVGRSMLVRKASVVPFECVVRGWLAGSGLKEYREAGTVCGLPLPPGLRAGDPLPEPIFTPATKATSGHDENVSFDVMQQAVGALAEELRARSIEIYRRAAAYAAERGIVLADTKFEWGQTDEGCTILVDEVLTPDSSRFWPQAEAGLGEVPASFDKQFVRDWLETTEWDKSSPPPALPDSIVEETRRKYLEAYRLLTGNSLA